MRSFKEPLHKIGNVSLPFYLVVLGTHTREKTEHYNTIARLRHLPFRFVQINRLEEAVHSAEEDTGDAVNNAIQKGESIQDVYLRSKTDPRYKRVLKTLCAQEGIPYSEDRILFATEDSQVRLLKKPIWGYLRQLMSPFVSKELLDRADKNGKDIGWGAETGLFAAAIGWEALAEMTRQAGVLAGYDRVDFSDEAVFTIRKLNAPEGSELDVLKENVTLTLTGKDLNQPIKLPKNTLHATKMFFSRQETPNVPNAENWEHFLTHGSVRSKLLMALYRHLEPTANLLSFPKKFYFPKPKLPKEEYKVAYLNEITWDEPPERNASTHAKIRHLLTPNEAAKKADAVVFPPLTGKSEKEKDFLTYLLYCKIVEKSLEAQSAYQGLIIQNDGSWTTRINLVYHMANVGMHGDHIRPSFAEKTAIRLCPDVKHTRTCYLDILESKSVKKLRTATNKLIDVRQRNSTPFKGQSTYLEQSVHAGPPANKDAPTTAVFISASNPNHIYIKQADAYGKFLARENHNFSWGAGDSPGKGMWAPYKGYLDAKGQHISGYSTPTILTIESKNSKMPEGCDYSVLCPDLPDRESRLIGYSDIIAGFPGGIGSLREDKGVVLVKKYLPEIGQNTKLILHSPDIHPRMGATPRYFWEPALPILLGTEAARELKNNHTALAAQGIYYSTSLAETKGYTVRAAQEWEANKKARQNNEIRVSAARPLPAFGESTTAGLNAA